MSETMLDLSGLRCPQPVLLAKKLLQNVPVGGFLVMECTDPLTIIEVLHFVNQTDHAFSGAAFAWPRFHAGRCGDRRIQPCHRLADCRNAVDCQCHYLRTAYLISTE